MSVVHEADKTDNDASVRLAAGRPVVRPSVSLFERTGKHYLFAPHSRTYMRVNEDLVTLLAACDGRASLCSLQERYRLGPDTVELVSRLMEHGVLVMHTEQTVPEAPAPAHPRTRRPAFTSITFFPTHACNLACRYCYADGGDRPVCMDEKTADTALGWFFRQLPKDTKSAGLSFHGGGEPTLAAPMLRRTIAQFRRECERRRTEAHVAMVSNGTFPRGVADWLLRNKIVVNFSIDGPPDIQNRQRPYRSGRPSHAVVAGNVRRFADQGCSVPVRVTVTSESVDRMPEILDHLAGLGASSVQLEPSFFVGRCLSSGLREPDPMRFATVFLECFLEGLRRDVDVSYSGLRCLEPARNRFCGACGSSVAVTPTGHLTTCFEVVDPDDDAARTFFVGQVCPDSDRVLLNNRRLRRLATRATENLPDCAECLVRYNCAGDCVVKSYRHSGSVFRCVPSRCTMAREVNAQIISWMADGYVEPRNPDSARVYGHGDCRT